MKRSLIATLLGLVVLLSGYLLTEMIEHNAKIKAEAEAAQKKSLTQAAPTPTASPTPTPTITLTPTPSEPTPIPLRDSVQLDVPIFNQQTLGYMSGCEIVSLGMLINYVTPVEITTLVAEMPRSADPTKGFRGEPTMSDGFTILPTALMGLTEKYLGQAKDMTGCSEQDLKEQLNTDHPIVIWVNGLGFNVHAICLTGYNQDGFFYNDPWTGAKDVFISEAEFSAIWNNPIFDEHLNISYPVHLALSY